MQNEDDLRGLAKVMEFMRAISILFVVIHIYWFCYVWSVFISNCIPIWVIAAVIILGLLLISVYQKFKVFEYNENNIQNDKELYHKLLDEILPDYSIEFIRNQNFRDSFRLENIQPFYDFRRLQQNPKYTFINPKIDRVKANLFNNIIDLVDIITTKSVPNENNIILLFDSVLNDNLKIKEIHDYANNICKYYDQLVAVGRENGL